jgi:NAD(P)H-hydrate epimerase
VSGRSILVLCGSGGNGGGGMTAARQLAAAGAGVTVLLGSPPERLAPVPGRQLEILLAAGIPARFEPGAALPQCDLVLDALLGYSQVGSPRGEAARLVSATGGRRVLSLDTPSGLELGSGLLRAPHVRAVATVTLAAPKVGLRLPSSAESVGSLFLADLSIPPEGYARAGIAWSTPFGREPVVRVAL